MTGWEAFALVVVALLSIIPLTYLLMGRSTNRPDR